jgi:hypothetical protein
LAVCIFSLQLPICFWPAFQNGRVSYQLFIVTIPVILQGQLLACFRFLGNGYAERVQISSSTSILKNKISNKIVRCLKLTKNGLKFKYFIKQEKNVSQGSIISIVDRVCAGQTWIQIKPWQGPIFFLSTVSKSSLRPTQPAVSGYWELFPAGKVVRRAADHSSPSSAEVKNEWSYISTPLYICMLCTHRALLFFKTDIIQIDFFYNTT